MPKEARLQVMWDHPILSPKQLKEKISAARSEGKELEFYSSNVVMYRVDGYEALRTALVLDCEQETREAGEEVTERAGHRFGTAMEGKTAFTHTTSTSFLNSALYKNHRENFYFTAGLTANGQEAVRKAFKDVLPDALVARSTNDLLGGCIGMNTWADHMFYWGYGGSGLHCDRFLSLAVNVNVGDITLYFNYES